MSNKWNFAAPVVQGRVPRQAHANIPDGLWEREMGRDAFFGPCTDFYHRHAPTGWSAITGEGLSPHLVDTSRLPSGIGSPWQAVDLLCNASVRIRHWRATASMDHLVRNADGDELLFIHDGTCDLLCDFGHLSLVKGD